MKRTNNPENLKAALRKLRSTFLDYKGTDFSPFAQVMEHALEYIDVLEKGLTYDPFSGKYISKGGD